MNLEKKMVSLIRPHPGPLPRGEGEPSFAPRHSGRPAKPDASIPLEAADSNSLSPGERAGVRAVAIFQRFPSLNSRPLFGRCSLPPLQAPRPVPWRGAAQGSSGDCRWNWQRKLGYPNKHFLPKAL